MAEGAATTHTYGKLRMADLLKARTLKVLICSGSEPAAGANTVYSDLTAYATTTAKTLSNMTTTINGTGVDLDNTVDLTWAALALQGGVAPAFAALYDDTADPKNVIGTWTLGTTMPNGGDYTLAFSNSPAAVLTVS